MGRPRISKMVTRRQRAYKRVEWFLRVHRQQVGEALELFLRRIEAPGWTEDDPPADVKAFLDRLSARLEAALDQLVEAEHRHLNETAASAEPRQRRDRWMERLREMLFRLRDLFRGAYGWAVAEEVGFEKRIASDALSLARQGERVLVRLNDPELEMPEPGFGDVEISLDRVAGAVEGALEQLRRALDDISRSQAEVQGTKIAKDQAMERFDDVFSPIVKILRAAFRLAGYDELAARIPSSLRRLLRTVGRD